MLRATSGTNRRGLAILLEIFQTIWKPRRLSIVLLNYTFNYIFMAFHTIIPLMGFPTWTLVGMGITALGALLTTLLTYLALWPGVSTRLGFSQGKLETRLREFVGFTLAFLLLAFGFFLAGVPLEQPGLETAVVIITATPPRPTVTATVKPTVDLLHIGDEEAIEPVETRDDQANETGSFGGPPTTNTPISAEDDASTAASDQESAPTQTATGRPIPPTATTTRSPTATPTVTPVPPLGETAVVQTGGNTLWVRRTPGGKTLSLLNDGDTIVLASGSANWQGIQWRQIRTLDGTLGWIQNEFIQLEE